jgi:transposase InsO family protein
MTTDKGKDTLEHNQLSTTSSGGEVATETGEWINMHESAKLADSGAKYDMSSEVHIAWIPRGQPHDQLHELVIPEEVRGWLVTAHGPHRGHLGYTSTVDNLFKIASFRRVALKGQVPRDLETYIKHRLKSCDVCQKMSVKRPVVQAMHFTFSVYNPMERVAVDYIEKLTVDIYGNYMIVVIIDCFSRFVTLYPVQSTKSKVFAEVFLKWIGTFGSPKSILSDRGSQFMSNLVQSIFKLSGIDSITVTPGSKQENSIVERENREVMRHLRNIVYDVRVPLSVIFKPTTDGVLSPMQSMTVGSGLIFIKIKNIRIISWFWIELGRIRNIRMSFSGDRVITQRIGLSKELLRRQSNLNTMSLLKLKLTL